MDDVDIAVAHRVAFDTLTPTRLAALRLSATGQKPPVDLSRTTLWRALRDLMELGVVASSDDVSHVLTTAFRRYWLAAKIDPTVPKLL